MNRSQFFSFANHKTKSKPYLQGELKNVILLLLGIFCFSKTVSQPKDSLPLSLENKVSQLINKGIQQRAFPGAQVLLYKKGQTLLHQSYGFHTYDSLTPVSNTDLYDLASVTKVMASTLVFMKLYELYNIDLDQKVSHYVSLLKHSNKKNTTYREVLSHSAGWLPYIVHQDRVRRKNGSFKNNTLASASSRKYPTQISQNLFIHKNYKKKIMRRIRRTPLSTLGEYKYSGLWFFLLPQLTEQLSGLPFDDFLNRYFYEPMGLERIAFIPSKKFSINEIVPTEIDSLFRKQLVQGWVHDEAAAMMGGFSGNAGLFANAASLKPLLQMLLQMGEYNGKRYLQTETVSQFTQKTYPDSKNRRGLGFDKPETGALVSTYPSKLASPDSYGHSGFTGTFIWADPQQEAIMIFLSNRVYPTRAQNGIYTLNIRGQLLDYLLEE